MIVKSFHALCRVSKLPSLSNKIGPYIIFDRQLIGFTVLALRRNGFAPIMYCKSLEDATVPLSCPDEVYPEAYGRTGGQDTAFRYIIYVLFDMMHDAVGNNGQYELGTN